MIPFLIIPAVVAVITLAYAAVLDILDRKVPHTTWYALIIIGLPASALFYITVPPPASTILLGIAVVVAIGAFCLARFGIFGGADAVAIILVSLFIPTFPVSPVLGIPDFSSFPVMWLMNTAIVSFILIVGNTVYSIARHRTDTWLSQGFPLMVPLYIALWLTLLGGDVAGQVVNMI